MDCTESCWQLVELKTLERLGGFPRLGGIPLGGCYNEGYDIWGVYTRAPLFSESTTISRYPCPHSLSHISPAPPNNLRLRFPQTFVDLFYQGGCSKKEGGYTPKTANSSGCEAPKSDVSRPNSSTASRSQILNW